MFRQRSIQPELIELKITESPLIPKDFPRMKTAEKAIIGILGDKPFIISTHSNAKVVEKLETEFLLPGHIYQPGDLIADIAKSYEILGDARVISAHETLGVKQAVYTVGRATKKETSYAPYETIKKDNITLKLYPAVVVNFDDGNLIHLMEIDFQATYKEREIIKDTVFMVFKNPECKNSDKIKDLFFYPKLKEDPALLRSQIIKRVDHYESGLLAPLNDCFRMTELAMGNTCESVLAGVLLFQSRHLSGPKPSDKISYKAVIQQAELLNLLFPFLGNTTVMDYFSIVLNV